MYQDCGTKNCSWKSIHSILEPTYWLAFATSLVELRRSVIVGVVHPSYLLPPIFPQKVEEGNSADFEYPLPPPLPSFCVGKTPLHLVRRNPKPFSVFFFSLTPKTKPFSEKDIFDRISLLGNGDNSTCVVPILQSLYVGIHSRNFLKGLVQGQWQFFEEQQKEEKRGNLWVLLPKNRHISHDSPAQKDPWKQLSCSHTSSSNIAF